MKNFQSHYDELKSLLRNESRLDKDALRENFEIAMENAEKDINLLDFDDEDRDVVSALMHRIQRMHSLGHHDYVRDDISQLSFYPEGMCLLLSILIGTGNLRKELYQPIHNYFRDMLNKEATLDLRMSHSIQVKYFIG